MMTPHSHINFLQKLEHCILQDGLILPINFPDCGQHILNATINILMDRFGGYPTCPNGCHMPVVRAWEPFALGRCYGQRKVQMMTTGWAEIISKDEQALLRSIPLGREEGGIPQPLCQECHPPLSSCISPFVSCGEHHLIYNRNIFRFDPDARFPPLPINLQPISEGFRSVRTRIISNTPLRSLPVEMRFEEFDTLINVWVNGIYTTVVAPEEVEELLRITHLPFCPSGCHFHLRSMWWTLDDESSQAYTAEVCEASELLLFDDGSVTPMHEKLLDPFPPPPPVEASE